MEMSKNQETSAKLYSLFHFICSAAGVQVIRPPAPPAPTLYPPDAVCCICLPVTYVINA